MFSSLFSSSCHGTLRRRRGVDIRKGPNWQDEPDTRAQCHAFPRKCVSESLYFPRCECVLVNQPGHDEKSKLSIFPFTYSVFGGYSKERVASSSSPQQQQHQLSAVFVAVVVLFRRLFVIEECFEGRRSKSAKNISLRCENDDLDRRPVVAWNYDDQRRVDFVGGVVSGRRKESANKKKYCGCEEI